MTEDAPRGLSHDDVEYTHRLQGRRRWWKTLVGVDRWYGSKARRASHGRVLEVGCGVGRLLAHLGSDAVGVDTNPHSVAVAKERGLTSLTVDEFLGESRDSSFDTILFAHVLEHMTNEEATGLLLKYLPFLRQGGRVVVIVPQEAGFASDPTHIEYLGLAELTQIAQSNRLRIESLTSFPLPRIVGKYFKYNETVAVMTQLEG